MKTNKILFACDLDNTLMHSHKHKIDGDICVEILDGKEQSFVTPLTYSLIEKVTAAENITLLPVTTRSVEQYKRIKWPTCCTPELALVCNGSILLRNGEPDTRWLKTSDSETAPYMPEIESLYKKYSDYECFKTVRIVNNKFLFAYCIDREKAGNIAAGCSKDTEQLTVELSGSKLYFFPPPANKGRAVNRFIGFYKADSTIAAGDSTIDCSMLDSADTALVPDSVMADRLNNKNCFICNKDERFSEFILSYVMKAAGHQSFRSD